MATMSGAITVLKGTTSAEQTTDKGYHQLPMYDANRRKVRGWGLALAAVADGAADADKPITTDWRVGQSVAADAAVISDADRFPQPREDHVASAVGAPGDLVTLKFTDPDGAHDSVVRWRIDLLPVY